MRQLRNCTGSPLIFVCNPVPFHFGLAVIRSGLRWSLRHACDCQEPHDFLELQLKRHVLVGLLDSEPVI